MSESRQPDERRRRTRIQMPAAGILAIVALAALLTAQIAKSDWTRAIRHESKPAKITTLQSFKSPEDTGDNYAARVRGFVYPPKSGDYVLAITADDQSKPRWTTVR